MKKCWHLNSSNQGKREEFQRLFARYNIALNLSDYDLPEIDSDPINVVIHKASQLPEMTLVEDSSLDIEGAEVGIHVRYLLDQLSKYTGKKASWQLLLAFRRNEEVAIYRSIVKGKIVSARGIGGFGFDAIFQPDNSTKTLAEEKSDSNNARALAVNALLTEPPYKIAKRIESWEGEWQDNC